MKKRSTTKHPMRQLFLVLAVSGALMSAGCMSVGPEYVRPETPVPDQWHSDIKNGLVSQTVDTRSLTDWWQALNDPVLSDLIERAVAGNRDIKQAKARIREARARRGISKAGFFPTLSASAAATKSGSRQSNGLGGESELYSAGFDAGWELDLFGGVRRSVEAAQADMAASAESLRDTLVSLLAEVALNYVDARTYQARLDVAQANLLSQEETYLITRSRFEAGLSSELPVQQALYSLSSTRSSIPSLETGLEATKNRLAVLLGLAPGQVHDELEAHRPIPVVPATVAVGIPADLLRQRPDVRQVERLLAAQTAQIGVATAELYPKIRLSGSIGLEALSIGDLFNAATRTWSVGPGISWPIFDAGAIHANIAVQSALQEQALYQYEQAILSALEEVENSLTAFGNEQIRRYSLTTAIQAAQKAVVLAQDQYKAGVVGFSDVLEAQRSALSFQDQLAQSDGTVTTNLISLYKSMGGGWTSIASDTQLLSE